MPKFVDRLQHAWNAFLNPSQKTNYSWGSSLRPDRPRLTRGNERSIVSSVYNRISIDVAAIKVKHCKLDDNGRFLMPINSDLNNCLTVEANKDQTSRDFIQDIAMSMMDEGCVAVVPVDTTINPEVSGSYDIQSMRTARIIAWMPDHVKVQIYNDRTGNKQDVILPKKMVAIVINPFYQIMNEPNSTLQRLIRKLNLLDVIDEQSGSGKLDLIIQLPYAIRTDARRSQAEERKKDIEMQLANSKFGIAYTDSTEKVTQLNRSLDNNLMKQIEYLTSMLYSQLGITTEILNGTASNEVMTNYNSRVIEPMISAIVDEMNRKFLTKTARTKKQAICFFNDPFKLVPITNLADIADKFTRNTIMSPNELRQIVGLMPVQDAKADELRNRNLNAGEGESFATTTGEEVVDEAVTKEE